MRAREVRGFSSTSYFTAPLGLYTGSSTGFSVSALIRCMTPSDEPEAHLWGNFNSALQQGWRLSRLADVGGFGIQYSFDVWAGGILHQASIQNFPGAAFGAKFTSMHGIFDGVTGSLTLHIFGFLIGGTNIGATTFAPCAGTPSIGFNVNESIDPTVHTAVSGVTYSARVLTSVEIGLNNLEMLKRCDVSSGGLNIPWEAEYSFLQDCGVGVAQTVRNRQNADAPLTATGRNMLINGSPRIIFGL